jgi:glycosyltransferase involved in cell wall biosynthesis
MALSRPTPALHSSPRDGLGYSTRKGWATDRTSMNVSVLICTFKSRSRLPETLAHLKRQRVPADLTWEVLIVDHVPGDDGIQYAMELWGSFPVPLRCFAEPRRGKSPALETGFAQARGEAVCVVDDDNWVDPDYIAIAHRIMTEHSEVGVIGACGEAACEVAPPGWFADLHYMYAVGHQASRPGFTDGSVATFWGAGSVIRRSAWTRLKAIGFVPIMNPCREDGVTFNPGFTGGEDPEICYGIQYAGYRLWYEPSLKYRHYIPAQRLTIKYVETTAGGVNMAAPILKIYRARLEGAPASGHFRTLMYNIWWLHFATAVMMFGVSLLRQVGRKRTATVTKELRAYRGQVAGLWYWRSRYKEIVAAIDRLKHNGIVAAAIDGPGPTAERMSTRGIA